MLNFKNFIHREWTCHQQDFFGWLEVIVGGLEFIDMQTVNLVAGFLGPKYGPIFAKVLQISIGLRIAYIGYQHRKAHA